MLPTKLWAEMSWKDFQSADMANVIAVLPVAAIEQHGPHLPIGKSNEHIEFPGTLTFSVDTVIRAWTEIGESVARAGCRKLVFVNSHGGNVPAIDIVARDLRVRRNMLVVNSSWSRFGYPDGMFGPKERAHGIHAGDYETSAMLAFRPELVRMREARDFVSAAVDM
jgi:creatinine amidohydrolase